MKATETPFSYRQILKTPTPSPNYYTKATGTLISYTARVLGEMLTPLHPILIGIVRRNPTTKQHNIIQLPPQPQPLPHPLPPPLRAPRLVQLLHPRQQLILQLPIHRPRHPVIADRNARLRHTGAVVNRQVLVRPAIAVFVKVQQVERRVAAVVRG